MMKCNEVITNDSVHNNNKIERIIAQADVATRVGEPEKTAELMKEFFKSMESKKYFMGYWIAN